MPLHMPRAAATDALRYLVNKAAPEDLVLRLFKNDMTPADNDTAASYDEATFPGYRPVVLAGAQWSATDTRAQCAEQVFTRTEHGAVERVYGYYLTRAKSGRIAWAERFEQAVPVANAGDVITITPGISVRAL